MARITEEKNFRINISLHPSVIKKLDTIASDLGMSRSECIATGIRIVDAIGNNKDLESVIASMIKGLQQVKPEKKGKGKPK